MNEKNNVVELDSLLSEMTACLNKLYDKVKDIILENGGLMHTQKADASDVIRSLEIEGCYDVTERVVCGLRVVNDDIQIFSEIDSPTCIITVTEEDLKNPELEDEWNSLKYSDAVFYLQTLVNIAENIEFYTNSENDDNA